MRALGTIAGVGILYLAAASVGVALAVPGLSFTTFWMPGGVAIAAYVAIPRSRWPALTVAILAAHAIHGWLAGYPLALAVPYTVIDVSGALLGAVLIGRAFPGVPVARSVRALLRLLAALLVSTGAVAAAGATAVWLVEGEPFARSFGLWWASDILGAAVVVPGVLHVLADGRRRPSLPRAAEAVALLVVAAAVAEAVFHERGAPPFQLLLVPPLLWAALRFGMAAVGAVGAVNAVVAMVAVTDGGFGVAAGLPAPTLAAYLQLLLGVQLAAFYVLAAAMEERRRALADARASEERFQGLLRHAPVALYVKDAATRLLTWSAEFEKLLRVPPERLRGRTNAELFPPDLAARFDEEDRAVLAGGAPVRSAQEVGGRFYQTVKFRLSGADGEPLVCGISEDVTDRRSAEAASRMASLGTLAAGVAHEINNPLSFVMANVSFSLDELRRRPGDPRLAEVASALGEAQDGARRVRDIVRDLRAFARPADETRRDPVDVREPLRAALAMARNEIRHRARVIEDLGEAPPVLANEHQLGQVFLNLLVNAAHAIRDGDVAANAIGVRTGTTPRGEVVVEVRDTGRGMPPEEQARIFEPFFTTKPVGGGLGLGLFLSQAIVRGLDGRVEVESAPGRGSTFRVVLPPAPADVRAARAPVEAPARAAGRRVLVIDDEPLVARSVERMLRGDHRVDVTCDPGEALRRIEAGERWDAILCDVMMPQISGMDFEARLCAIAPELCARTIYMTGGAFTEAARAFLADPRRRHVAKPFDAAALRAAIAALPQAELPAAQARDGTTTGGAG